MHTLAALTPLLIVCLALALRRGAITAALLGIASIVGLSLWLFPYDGEMVWLTVDALWLPTIEIALIVLGGILLSEILEAVGAQNLITEHLIAATGTKERATLLMVIGLVPFLESSIGYGLGIIITVPLLRKMGNSATKSVALSLYGLTLTPWGSLGPGLIITAELGGISLAELGQSLSLLAIVPLLILNLAIVVIAVPAAKRLIYGIEVLIVTLVMWGGLLLTNFFISVPLGGIFAAMLGILCLLMLARIRGTKQRSLLSKKLLIATTPYLTIIVGVVLASSIAPLFGNPLVTRLATSPATWLLLSSFVSVMVLQINSDRARTLLSTSGKRWLRPGTIIMLYMLFGGLLNASGMSTALAEGASILGLWNLLLIPGVNIIAGYVTASVSATGAMFSLSAAETAGDLGLSKSSVLALQTLASAKATIFAPSRFALAAAALASEVRKPDTGEATQPPEDRVQVGKIVFGGFAMVLLMLPFMIGMTWILGQGG